VPASHLLLLAHCACLGETHRSAAGRSKPLDAGECVQQILGTDGADWQPDPLHPFQKSAASLVSSLRQNSATIWLSISDFPYKWIAMKKLYGFMLVITIICSGCVGRTVPTVKQPNEIRTTQQQKFPCHSIINPIPTSLLTPTQSTAIPSLTFTATSTREPTIKPYVETYPLKKVWIEFGSKLGTMLISKCFFL